MKRRSTATASRRSMLHVQRQAALPYAHAQKSKSPGFLERHVARIARRFTASGLNDRALQSFIREVHDHDERVAAIPGAAIPDHAVDIAYRLKTTGMARSVVAEAFALVREVAGRELGTRHYDVQLAGGWVMLSGRIAEMETGEGKTLTATLAASTAALAGIPVHVITVNDYLAGRDAEIMRPVYESLGLTCGASLADMSDEERRAAYRCDVTYTTNKQVAFDHLRDRIKLRGRNSQLGLSFLDQRSHELLLRGLHYALIDEADSVLVDEAVTPLIISRRGKAIYPEHILQQALDTAGLLIEGEHYELKPVQRSLNLLPPGRTYLADWADSQEGLWRNTRYREQLVAQALKALYLFKRDQQYLVDEGKVKIIDEFTGRLMPDRSWEQGLHQLIELKERCEITGEMETMGRISYQRFFRRYLMLGGMSGTIREVSGELQDVYGVSIKPISTNRKSQRLAEQTRLFASQADKWQYVLSRIGDLSNAGRPVLVGTRSVDASEHLGRLLTEAGIDHQVLNAREDAKEAEVVAMAGQKGQITVATNMAGRGTDIKLGPGIHQLGGLHVIATEMHEAGRIDRQLYGRCGRQGDPGSYELLVALDDDLVRRYAPRSHQWIARRLLGTRSDRATRLALFITKRAQARAERCSAAMRLRMQKLDEYLGNVLAFSGRME